MHGKQEVSAKYLKVLIQSLKVPESSAAMREAFIRRQGACNCNFW